jgi:uncharacterized protein YjbI with pentapeptide repeats
MAETVSICRIDKIFPDDYYYIGPPDFYIGPPIECNNTALPGDPDGFCILHSQNDLKDRDAFKEALLARWDQEDSDFCDFRGVFFSMEFHPLYQFGWREFEKPVYFSRASFTLGVDFSKASFAGSLDFSGARFFRSVKFLKARFAGPADFSGASFAYPADFSGASFGGMANFSQASFKGTPDFSGVSFSGKTDFSGAGFAEEADFSGVSFSGETDFSGAIFLKKADFPRAKVIGRVLFHSLNVPPAGKPHFPFQGDFRNLELSPEAVLRFQDFYLAQAEFAGTDLREIEFHNVQWHPYGRRQTIYDEIVLRQQEKETPWFLDWVLRFAPYADFPSKWGNRYSEVERLYRNLEVNYERNNDYKSSGDFHYGELEMHRRASTWRLFPLYWYNLYWLSSGYGERPLRAVLTLLGLLLAFSGFLLWAEGESLGGWHWDGIGKALLYVFQQGTLQKPDWLRPATNPGKFLSALMPVLIPGQTALFFLALRNRLGRRR